MGIETAKHNTRNTILFAQTSSDVLQQLINEPSLFFLSILSTIYILTNKTNIYIYIYIYINLCFQSPSATLRLLVLESWVWLTQCRCKLHFALDTFRSLDIRSQFCNCMMVLGFLCERKFADCVFLLFALRFPYNYS